jgi:hypothetical protein
VRTISHICSYSYVSKSTRAFSKQEVNELRQLFEHKNLARDITGVLYHHEGLFFQTLEGIPNEVDALLDRIKSDNRHTQFTLVNGTKNYQRLFPDWGMHVFDSSLFDRNLSASIDRLRRLDDFVYQMHKIFLNDIYEKRPLI